MRRKHHINNQQGFASIVIALVLIIVLSLMTVGFAQLARREQQTALNKQLSTQAFYAAESGVNDVIDSMSNLLLVFKADHANVDKDHCLNPAFLLSPPDPLVVNHTSNVSNASGISYSCVLVNLQPPNLHYTGVAADVSRTTTFSTTGKLDSVVVNWSSDGGNNTARTPTAGSCSPLSGNCFPPTSSWGNSPAVVQFSITRLGQNTLTRDDLTAKTFTAYLYPSSDTPVSGKLTYDPTNNQGPIVGGSCAAPIGTTKLLCKVEIDGLSNSVNGGPAGASGDYYLIRMVPRYDNATTIDVNNAQTLTHQSLDYVGGQAQIDVTGKAKTVLKRIQVRVKITGDPTGNSSNFDLPNTTIEAGDVCKRLATYPALTDFVDTNGTTFPGPTPDACNLDRY